MIGVDNWALSRLISTSNNKAILFPQLLNILEGIFVFRFPIIVVIEWNTGHVELDQAP